MTCDKPEHIKGQIWKQHLIWLDLVSIECNSNQVKRERKKHRKGE